MRAAKAVVAAVVAGAASLSYGLQDGTLSLAEGITAALALIIAYGGTWAVPNAPDPRQRRELEVLRARYSRTYYGGAGTSPPPLPPLEHPDVD